MSKRKILLVDDEEKILRALTRVFQDDMYEISTETNGLKGLERVRNDDFQLVISDYRMPEMDGVEFLKQVRKISPDIIRIILTGYADVDTAVSAINEGHVYKFLTKPWEEKFLKVQIKRAFELYDLQLERKALHEELECKNKELEELNKNLEKMVEERTQQLLHSEKMASLGQIASQIGHEINNSLTILKGRMELTKYMKKDSEYIEKALTIFSKEFDRLAIHTRNLLSFGKPAPPEFKNINIKDVLDSTMENLIYSGVMKYYTINKEYEYDVPLIYGDASQIEQVFTNIFINSHHAMGSNGMLTVTVKLSDDNEFIKAIIKDTGKGIPEENFKKIFEPFFTTKPEGKGTGLGLSVVKKIVESHKGYIQVHSNVDAGTTMTVGFPASQCSCI